MRACGIWREGRRLCAVFVDDDGRTATSVRAAADDDARWSLLECIDAAHGLDWALVLPGDLLRVDSIGRLALARGHELWAAPQRLVDAIRAAAGLGRPTSVAALPAACSSSRASAATSAASSNQPRTGAN